MALNIPNSASEIVSRAKTAVQRALPSSNPFLPNSWLSALITAFAYRIYDFYLQLNQAIKQTFWNTSTGENLEEQASWFGVTRLAATQAEGNIAVTGVDTTSVPINTLYQTSDGLEFKVTSTTAISAQSVGLASITRSGTTATAVFDSPHNLASNVPVSFSGADQANFNQASAQIQVVDTTTVTYQVEDTGDNFATGTLLAGFTSGSVPVKSEDFGQSTNLPLDSVLSLQSPIAGVNDDANVDAGEMAGGADQETDEQLRTRFLDRVQNPVANFNVAAIINQAKKINGVTRVFVFEITPDVGQVTVYFMRDNDDDPIPTAPEVAAVKTSILEIKPANTADVDVIVEAPVPVQQIFNFGSIVPNTAAMKAAVEASLEQFFEENTQVGVDVQKAAYDSAIFNTVDSSGQRLQSWTLTTPSSNILVDSNEIATLGAVNTP